MKYVFDELAQHVKRHPALFSLYGRLKERSHYNARVLRQRDHILIDGYPRSANTFATAAFIISQPYHIRIGNHCHAPGQFFLAKRWEIPAIMLIRHPEDAIVSYFMYRRVLNPLPLPILIRRYIFFYESVVPIRESYVVGAFDEVTKDFGAIVNRVNARYATTFSIFHHTAENVLRVGRFIEEQRRVRREKLGRQSSTLRTPLPHYDRQLLQASVKEELMKGSNRELLQKARDIFEQVLHSSRM